MVTYLADFRTADMGRRLELLIQSERVRPLHGNESIAELNPKNDARVFYYQCDREPHGIVASGYIRLGQRSQSEEKESIQVTIDHVLKQDEVAINYHKLRTKVFEKFGWTPTSPAIEIPNEIATELELVWSKLINTIVDTDPPWTREELILLLDCFVRRETKIPDPNRRLFKGCCSSINNLPIKTRFRRLRRYRNPGTIFLKMLQFARWDPQFRAELTSEEDLDQFISEQEIRVQRLGYFTTAQEDDSMLQMDTYLEFYNESRRLRDIAEAIRLAADHYPEAFVGEHFEDDFAEGHVMTYLHRVFESLPRTRIAKLESLPEPRGGHSCEICGFNFFRAYGKVGYQYTEFHHTLPLEQLNMNLIPKPEELIPVCSNCHRMLHRRNQSFCRERIPLQELSRLCAQDRQRRENA